MLAPKKPEAAFTGKPHVANNLDGNQVTRRCAIVQIRIQLIRVAAYFVRASMD